MVPKSIKQILGINSFDSRLILDLICLYSTKIDGLYLQVTKIIFYCLQLIVTNFFDDVLDNETFDVIDDEAVNLLALVSDE